MSLMRRCCSSLLALLLLVGCSNLRFRSTGQAVLLLRPSFGNGSYTSQTEVPVYSKDTINHLVLKLFTVNGETETPVLGSGGEVSRDVLKADLDNSIVIGNLKANTTYRIRAYAYKAAGVALADLISDPSSYIDVPLETNDSPTIAGLPVKLVDRNFAGWASSSIAVTSGGYSTPYSESFASYYNTVYRITTMAGGVAPENCPATTVMLNTPSGVACDTAGNVYVSDTFNHRIRKITPDGNIHNFAGNGVAGFSGDGCPATAAQIFNPWGLTADGAGNVYFTDSENKRIRKVSPDGKISTIAGNGTADYPGDGAVAIDSPMGIPYGVKVDGTGTVYIADEGLAMVRKVDTDGYMWKVAGLGGDGYNFDSGTATAVKLDRINDIAVDGAGSVYIADTTNNRIRKVTEGMLTTIAGNGTSGNTGDNNPATAAQISYPKGILVDAAGNLVFSSGNYIRKIDTNGIITTIAGNGLSTYNGEGLPALSAQIAPTQMAFDPSGNLIFADPSNHRVRKLANGVITTIAGTGLSGYLGGYNGDGGLAASAWLKQPNSVLARNNGEILIADTSNNRIRKIGTDGRISTIAGNGTIGYAAEGAQATEATVTPGNLAEDVAGNLYFIASYRVRKIDKNGILTTVAGQSSQGYTGDNVLATTTRIRPQGIALSNAGELYIADGSNSRVRKVDANAIITTIAGNGTAGYSGDGDQATLANIGNARDVTFDAAGNLYIAEGNSIRKVDKDGIITTVAGNGTAGYNADGIPATASQLNLPTRIVFDAVGNLYILDTNNNRIRKITSNGLISTIAGPWSNGYSGDNGPAYSAQLNTPVDLAVDRFGNVYVADFNNHAIRKLD